MKKKHYECQSCEAVFRLGFDMDPHFFPVKHCPFCGVEVEAESSWDIEDLNDES